MHNSGFLRKLDIDSWKRREHFHHFCSLERPLWELVVDLDCSVAAAAKSRGCSFFLLYLHATLQAANSVAEFGYRIVDDEVHCYGPVHASATIMRADETFGCCFIEYHPDFCEFAKEARQKMEITKARSGMCLENDLRHDLMYFSSVPWLKFSALSFVCNLKNDSVPKITFGKATGQGEKKLMPVALQVHHALVDGLQVSRFFDFLQQALDNV